MTEQKKADAAGTTMEVEYALRIVPIDANLPANVRKMADEGYQLVPGHTGLGIYMLWRLKNGGMAAQPEVQARQPEMAAAGAHKFTIDESKVLHIRDGKVIDADGHVIGDVADFTNPEPKKEN